MRIESLIIPFGFLVVIAGCGPDAQGGARSNNVAPPSESVIVTDPAPSSLFVGFDALVDGGDEGDGDCRRWIDRADGQRICVDALIAIILADHPKDNDNDGIPNISDEDIDGDGIPNGYDLDVDGDGVPNGYDDDIDDDGVPNAVDVDIDGDFLRNRWDMDMDGDLILNPHDRDADADGALKYPEGPEDDDPECGAADIFRNPDDCDLPGCKKSSSGNASSGGSRESKCDDKGKNTGSGANAGQNMKVDDMASGPAEDPEEPTSTERELASESAGILLEEEDDPVETLSDADPDAEDGDVLDALTDAVEAALEEDDVDPTGAAVERIGPEGREAFAEQVRSIQALTGATSQGLAEASDMVRMLRAAESQLGASLPELTETVVRVHENAPRASVMEDAATAVSLHEISDAAGLPPRAVVESVEPLARVTFEIEGEDDMEPVWDRIVTRTREHVSGDGVALYSATAVVETAEAISIEVDDLTLELFDESLDNVLDATEAANLTQPLRVVYAMVDIEKTDPNFSIEDGISAAEAERGAMAVLASM
ncbi:MAG: hypothetical protein KDA33_03800 [Phycisphaerales bacterium]|nr:hypothetical protein [Phycisphaerales bacterium]